MAKGKITSINRTVLRELRSELDEALQAALSKRGLSGEVGNIRFTSTTFSAKLEVAIGGDAEEAERTLFNQQCRRYGFQSEDYGKYFNIGGKEYKLIGFKSRAKKYPIIGVNQSGSRYKFASVQVHRDELLSRKEI